METKQALIQLGITSLRLQRHLMPCRPALVGDPVADADDLLFEAGLVEVNLHHDLSIVAHFTAGLALKGRSDHKIAVGGLPRPVEDDTLDDVPGGLWGHGPHPGGELAKAVFAVRAGGGAQPPIMVLTFHKHSCPAGDIYHGDAPMEDNHREVFTL